MGGIEKGLWVLVAGLLAPVAIGLLCGFGNRRGQRLAFAHCDLRLEAGCNGCAADLIQGGSKGARRGRRHGRSKVLRGASGAGWSPMLSAPPVDA